MNLRRDHYLFFSKKNRGASWTKALFTREKDAGGCSVASSTKRQENTTTPPSGCLGSRIEEDRRKARKGMRNAGLVSHPIVERTWRFLVERERWGVGVCWSLVERLVALSWWGSAASLAVVDLPKPAGSCQKRGTERSGVPLPLRKHDERSEHTKRPILKLKPHPTLQRPPAGLKHFTKRRKRN